MAVGSVGNPQSVVLERFKPASASAPRDAAVQGWRLRLYFVSPLWVGALLLLGARISRQHEQRGYNRRSYNGAEVFLHFDLHRFFTVSRSASVIIHRTAAPIMIPFSICAEITGAALAGSAGGIERQEGWGWARLPAGRAARGSTSRTGVPSRLRRAAEPTWGPRSATRAKGLMGKGPSRSEPGPPTSLGQGGLSLKRDAPG